MSEKPESGWTFETLKEHFSEMLASSDRHCEQLIAGLDRRVFERFRSDKELRDKLEESVGTRLEGMNEFRHQLDKQAGTFITWPGLFAVSTTIAMVVFGAMELLIRLVLNNPTK